MSQDTALPTSVTPSGTEGPKTFKPSVSALREHRTRRQADRLVYQFAERFSQKNYFPEGGECLLFALLTQLPHWPADTEISIVDDQGDEIACYLQGRDETEIQHSVTMTLHDDGTFSGRGGVVSPDETLFRQLYSQTTSPSPPGGSNWIAVLRDEISALARAERLQIFDALVADAHISKSEPQNDTINPFLPYWTVSPEDWPLALWSLHVLNPQMPVERLETLLQNLALTPDEEKELLHNDKLPSAFATALAVSQAEWSTDKAIDSLWNTRTFDTHTDAFVRALAKRLLKARLGRDMVITEHSDGRYRPTGPDDNPVALIDCGEGVYGRGDQAVSTVGPAGTTADSFYLAITSQLEPGELSALGLESESDVRGLRNALGKLAIKDNGGWFESEQLIPLIRSVMPGWLRERSDADKNHWRTALKNYSRTVIAAQEAGLPEVEMYGEPTQVRDYARERLRDRLRIDHELNLEPDEVIVVTKHTEIIGGAITPGLNGGNVEVVHTTQEHSLTELSLSNIAFTNISFKATASVQNINGEPISALTASYISDLVDDLDVGESYQKFLTSRLLTSTEGQAYAQRYAQVMQAQMRFDALEAKMAGDFLDDGTSPSGQEDRGYKWVKAVLDEPSNSDLRALVEGHRIQVETLRINGMPLDWLLVIKVASHGAVRPVVVYTPQTPDGKCFRELNDLDDLKSILLDPAYLDYVVRLAPLKHRAKIKNTLVNNGRTMILDTRLHTGNFLEAAYETRVNRVIGRVDEYTTTNSEKNWESIWNIFETVGEVALAFTPFRIALPIAALRSVFAIAEGVHAVSSKEGKDASLYFLAAALFMLDVVPLSKISKIKPKSRLRHIGSAQTAPFIDRHTGILNFEARPALSHMPEGLELLSGGFFNGVHQKVSHGRSSFYLVRNGKAYPIEPDHKNHVWRMIDLNHPNATSKTPIFPDAHNVWRYHPTGGAGGALFKVDLSGYDPTSHPYEFFKKKEYAKAELLDEKILKIKADIEIDYSLHKFHGVGKVNSNDPAQAQRGIKDHLFSYDITGMPGSSKRGPWRLIVRQRADNKGVLVFEKIRDWH